MKFEIKIDGRSVKDKDLRALYLIAFGARLSTERMRKANLEFIVGSFGYRLAPLKDKGEK
jgi:hypothetical protein